MMARRGCVDVDRLPLQILLRENPSWQGTPVAVTKEERPQSPILALNREARARGLTVGMKYAHALSLVPSLKARSIAPERIAKARERIVTLLHAFTPDIEPCPFDWDALWVSVDGLQSLSGPDSDWIRRVRKALSSEGFMAAVVLGWTRFGTYAIARSARRSLVFASREQERAMMMRSSIDILPLSPKVKTLLRRLEVRTVEQFASLPPRDVARRFGREAGRLQESVLTDDVLPIQPAAVKERERCARRLDTALADIALLMPHIEELLAVEAGRAQDQREVISGLTLVLRSENGEVTSDLIRPAVPTLSTSLLCRLVELRLSSRQFPSGIVDVEIRSERAQPSRAQGELFSLRGRDLRAGARALAAIRARFGNEAVACARLADSYLPEQAFQWVAMKEPAVPASLRPRAKPAAVRRILFKPAPAPGCSTAEPLFIVCGSWWGGEGNDPPFVRHYSYRDSPHGLQWIYEDKLAGSTWIQGVVD